MPTGYTAAITEKDITFKQYALSCARAFGALIEMRDEPVDAQIPDSFEPSDYSNRAIESATMELRKLEVMTPEERLSYGEKAKADAIKSAEESLARIVAENEKYLAMRAQVEAWEPPTPDHVEMKEFMIEQINISLNDPEWSQQRLADAQQSNPMALYHAAVESCKRSIQYHEQSHTEEVKRTQGRTDWIRALKKSLN